MGRALITPLYKQFAKITDRLKADPTMDLENMRFLLEEIQVVTAEPTGDTYE
jgi:hypothetical protein